jgi:hypothetical protein
MSALTVEKENFDGDGGASALIFPPLKFSTANADIAKINARGGMQKLNYSRIQKHALD